MRGATSWRLSARITRWCFVVGTGFVGLLAVLGCFLFRLETQTELDAIALEELEEMIGGFANSRGRVEDFATISEALQRSHPGDAMAWRVWRRSDGSLWGSFGPPELVQRIPTTLGADPEIGRYLRWHRWPLNEELTLALLLEGYRERTSEYQYFLVAFSTLGIAACVSYFAGRYLGRRIGGALSEIADEARTAVHGEDLRKDLRGLPDEIKEVVFALREAMVRIREESDRARLLASGLAHELRSPLQNLLMQVEVALLRERAPEEYVTALSRQLLDLQELIRAVDNLVTLCASPETQKSRHEEVFDLVEQARLRLQAEVERATRGGVRVELDFPTTLTIRGDRETLVLALRNLLANAIDWSPPGGRVDVRLRVAERAWSIEVDDEGPGVPAEDRERIFNPFERGAPRPNGRIGYGLGLALVRMVMEMHGGTVEVASSPAGGARFRLESPLPPATARALAVEAVS